jgi:hypothetical protein
MAQLARYAPIILQHIAFYVFTSGTTIAQLRQYRCVTGQAKPSTAALLIEAVGRIPEGASVEQLETITKVSQRYAVVRDALPQPDPIRLRNREQLIAIVNTIVRDDLPIDDATVRRIAAPIATPGDIEPLVALAIAELHGLHEGVLARFRLRLSEFRRWRGRASDE